MEKVVLDAINHIKILGNENSFDTILQRINKISTTNLDTKALRSEKNDIYSIFTFSFLFISTISNKYNTNVVVLTN